MVWNVLCFLTLILLLFMMKSLSNWKSSVWLILTMLLNVWLCCVLGMKAIVGLWWCSWCSNDCFSFLCVLAVVSDCVVNLHVEYESFRIGIGNENCDVKIYQLHCWVWVRVWVLCWVPAVAMRIMLIRDAFCGQFTNKLVLVASLN